MECCTTTPPAPSGNQPTVRYADKGDCASPVAGGLSSCRQSQITELFVSVGIRGGVGST